MKAFHFLLGLVSLVFLSINAGAATSPHYSVSFSATLYTAVSTGSGSAILKITKVDNSTLFNAVVSSGSFPGLKASDMDVVFGDTPAFSVINKSTDALLYTLGVTGTETLATGEAAWGNTAKKIYVVETAKMDITVPNFETFETYGLLRAAIVSGNTSITTFNFMFNGYDGADVIEGVVRKTGKVYNY